MTITIEKLEELCHKYDAEMDEYPESKWEGQAVLEFIKLELGIKE
jgi:hypothetical protein